MTILITGGTGTLGRLVVPLLLDAGQKLRILSRHDQEAGDGIETIVGDLSTGEGVEAAVDGVQTIVHCAGSSKGDDEKTRKLVAEATRFGVRHLVYISVVGCDRVPVVSAVDRAMFGYFATKKASEEIISSSGIPWTTLRATQFHDLTLTVVKGMAKMPVIPVPSGILFQPVDTAEVAARLVELTLGAPAALVPDIAGPEIYGMDELVRLYLLAAGKRRLLMPMRLPGKAARAMREGANLARDRAVGKKSWEEFLAARVSA